MTVEIAKEIREELKANGINNKQVSVTSKHSAVNVSIKDLKIKIEEIEKITSKYEKISRCIATDEILSGGNVFIFTGYCSDSLKKSKETELYKNISEKFKNVVKDLDSGFGAFFNEKIIVSKSQDCAWSYRVNIGHNPSRHMQEWEAIERIYLHKIQQR
jgi:hypothetical protein